MIYETDWLNSNTVFYNSRTQKFSNHICDVIDFDSFEWHQEGLYNYLNFGYSVFGQTPVKNVKFISPNSKLAIEDNKLKIQNLDNITNYSFHESKEEEVLELISDKITNWEKRCDGHIIIPTSGGYDSRLLNLMINDRSKIRSFTYGISSNQKDSIEVQKAKLLSDILGIKWNQIELNKFNYYIDKWIELYGVSTHAHGMYHIEFYSKISNELGTGYNLLSGMIGDAWSGQVEIPKIKKIEDLKYLGYSHGLHADPNQLINKPRNFEVLSQYFESKRIILEDPKMRIIESMRTKSILLNYLIRIPETFGLKPFAPFIEEDIALKMLNLSNERRYNRVWQTEFFRKNSVNLEGLKIKWNHENSLDYTVNLNSKLPPLSSKLLSEIISIDYVEWINKNTLQRAKSRIKEKYLLKFPYFNSSFDLKAYYAYLTLAPLQALIINRNMYHGK